MAALVWRPISSAVRRFISPATFKYFSDSSIIKPEDIHKGKSASDSCEIADDLGQSVGIERMEHLAIAAGNDDPFEMKVIKKAKGTFDQPTIIKSCYKKRRIGCICEEEALVINCMWLYKGEPKRCECGYWFKLVDA